MILKVKPVLYSFFKDNSHMFRYTDHISSEDIAKLDEVMQD